MQDSGKSERKAQHLEKLSFFGLKNETSPVSSGERLSPATVKELDVGGDGVFAALAFGSSSSSSLSSDDSDSMEMETLERKLREKEQSGTTNAVVLVGKPRSKSDPEFVFEGVLLGRSQSATTAGQSDGEKQHGGLRDWLSEKKDAFRKPSPRNPHKRDSRGSESFMQTSGSMTLNVNGSPNATNTNASSSNPNSRSASPRVPLLTIPQGDSIKELKTTNDSNNTNTSSASEFMNRTVSFLSPRRHSHSRISKERERATTEELIAIIEDSTNLNETKIDLPTTMELGASGTVYDGDDKDGRKDGGQYTSPRRSQYKTDQARRKSCTDVATNGQKRAERAESGRLLPVVSLPLNTRLPKPSPETEATRMTFKRHSHNSSDMKSLLAHIQEKNLDCFVLEGEYYLPDIAVASRSVISITISNNAETVREINELEKLIFVSRHNLGLKPIAIVKELDSFNSKTIGNQLFFEYEDEERRIFASIFDTEHNLDYFHWVIAHTDLEKVQIGSEFVYPYSIITVMLQKDKVIFLNTSSLQGQRQSDRYFQVNNPEPLSKKGLLDRKRLKKVIESRWLRVSTNTQLEHSASVLEVLQKIETHKKSVYETIHIGIFYRSQGQNTLEDFLKKSTPKYSQKFYEFLEACGCSLQIFSNSPRYRAYQWRNLNIHFHLASWLSKDEVRQYVGNSMGVIIFNDSDEPFDPSSLFLGRCNSIIVVVQPFNEVSSVEHRVGKEKLLYKIGVYYSYEESKSTNDHLTERALITKFENFNSPPYVPKSYLFTSTNILDFLILKFYNSMKRIYDFHEQFHNKLYSPVSFMLQSLVKTNLPSFHNKIVSRSKT